MKQLSDAVVKAGESKGAGTKRLTKLEPGEVSLVSRAANRKKFYMTKNEDGTMPDSSNDSSHQQLLAAVQSISEADLEKIGKAAEQIAVTKADGTDGADSRLQTTLRAVGKMLVPYSKAREDGTPAITMADLQPILEAIGITDPDGDGDDDLPEDEAQEAGELVNMSVDKSVDGPGVGPGIEKADAAMSGTTKPEGVSDADFEAAQKAAKAAFDAAMAKAGYTGTKKADKEKQADSATTPKEDDMDQEDVAKSALASFPKEQRAALEPIFKAHKEAIAKAEAKAARLEEQLLRKDLVAKAAGYRNLGVETQELAEFLYDAQTHLPAERAEKFEKLLKSLDAQAGRGGLFNEMGSKASGSASGSAAEQLDAAVASLVAKSDGKSRAQVYRDFVKSPEGAELYKSYQIEQRRAQREA